jgi:hypothetical protein
VSEDGRRDSGLLSLAYQQSVHNRGIFFALFGAIVTSLAVWVEYGTAIGFIVWGGMLFVYGLTCQVFR